jgi:hypothetical protein
LTDGVIRCLPGVDHTNGFFVACFVRDGLRPGAAGPGTSALASSRGGGAAQPAKAVDRGDAGDKGDKGKGKVKGKGKGTKREREEDAMPGPVVPQASSTDARSENGNAGNNNVEDGIAVVVEDSHSKESKEKTDAQLERNRRKKAAQAAKRRKVE